MRVRDGLLVHSADVPMVTQDRSNNLDINTVSGSNTVMCRVQDDTGRTAMENHALTGTLTATGYFRSGSGIEKDLVITVTGDGMPSAGRKYLVKSPPQLVAGHGALYVVALEAIADG